MTGEIGKLRRLSHLIQPDTGRCFGVAFDHSLQLGACPGTERPEEMLGVMMEAGVDAVILPLGMARRCGHVLTGRGAPALILRLDQTSMWRNGSAFGYPEGHTRLVAAVDDAGSLGADAVITYMFVGHKDPELETRAIEDNARVNAEARAAGMVHIIETMAARDGLAADPFDPAVVALHARIGAELGADVLKTDWPGSAAALRPIADDVKVPVLVAGGPRGGTDRDAVAFVEQVVAGGGAGILFGRAVIQAKNPGAVMKAMRRVIHDGISAVDAASEVGI